MTKSIQVRASPYFLRSAAVRKSFCEQLANVSEGLDLQSTASRVEKEHGCLLTNLASEPDIRLDDEGNASPAQSLCQPLPVLHRKHHSEVWNGNIMAVHGIVVRLVDTTASFQMRDNLMAE